MKSRVIGKMVDVILGKYRHTIFFFSLEEQNTPQHKTEDSVPVLKPGRTLRASDAPTVGPTTLSHLRRLVSPRDYSTGPVAKLHTDTE